MPRILVSMYLQPEEDRLCLRRDHIRRLRRSGALPLLLPHIDEPISGELAREYLAGCHGLLLTGGGDIEPRLYGREPGPDTFVDPARDQAEIALTRAAWEMMLPVFGICRGAQVINVALGGDIYQDLDADKGSGNALHQHGVEERRLRHHPVRVTVPELERLIGEETEVNSLHHQGLRRIAAGLIPAAWAEDGLCEAVIAPDRPLLAVQWHPECLPGMEVLFDDFVEKCRAFAAGE